jgi:hypothetical protein
MEKRQHLRFLPCDEALAAVQFRIAEVDSLRVGSIKDISMGGLALRYPSRKDLDSEPSYIDIFIPQDEFYLPRVLCRVVYDIALNKSYGNPGFVSSYVTKQCGVKFQQLSTDEIDQLNLFLRKHTAGVVPKADKA